LALSFYAVAAVARVMVAARSRWRMAVIFEHRKAMGTNGLHGFL